MNQVPVVLPPNVIDHFYAGGGNIERLRGFTSPTPADGVLRRPEEWLAATTHRFGEDGLGLSRLPDGRLLRDAVAADPQSWLGVPADAAAALPAGDTGLLVKLLDAGQRLPVHVHPDRAFARSHLDCPYGKTESWFVLGTTGEEPSVWLGFTEDVEPDELQRRVDAQDSAWMLSRMHRVRVRPGDGILLPAGTVHAIGEGVFVAELQEPSDWSILLEWSVTTATLDESHLGLGFPRVMGAVNHRAMSADQVAALVVHTDPDTVADTPVPLLPAAADPFFRLQLCAPDGGALPSVDAGFAVVVVLAGAGRLTGSDGPVDVAAGQVLAVPHAFGDWTVSGEVRLLACRPGAGWPETLSTQDGPR
ncbi:class I mannose-6-phosphate isomerase [Nakamurella endophytica]|uniref:Phosphomannose isomerase n=1 Tax=Nakamurella endophytica TaxID=1748367 RepID=A0A917WKL8_9ACTN|nr:class I mannose-6-phosphate isomerase [Nakamurella endophytica]GGM10856.1 phosphomannose isomerase [Nakamurella endophytica]